MTNMIKIILTFAILQITFGANRFEEWSNFKKTYGKNYANAILDSQKFNNFRENLEYIDRHNSAGVYSYKLGINQLADLGRVDYMDLMLVDINQEHRRLLKSKGFKNEPIPDKIDWREKGCVTPVKYQGQCGSATLIAAVGALEGQECQVHQPLVSLSVQQLVDCCNLPIEGVTEYYKCVKNIGGLDAADCYPAKAQCQKSACTLDPKCVAVTVNGFSEINKGDESALKAAVGLMGPVAVCVDASRITFQLYQSGIYDDILCDDIILDHCMLAVGYGKEGNKDYWIVKNSWGSNWGEGGYIRMVRNKKNRCGIATLASYPILKQNYTLN